jgi:hypothetical protein
MRCCYWLLIVDSHGSQVTMALINYCDANKILLVVFPPHVTHNLQPLDVVMFAPLSAAYSVVRYEGERRFGKPLCLRVSDTKKNQAVHRNQGQLK